MKLSDPREMFFDELRRLYDAEHQIIEYLPRMKEMASTPRLRQLFEEHIRTNDEQVARFEKVFRMLAKDPERIEDPVARAILGEVDDIEADASAPMTVDAKLIAIGRRFESYEVAVYGTLTTMAELMDHRRVAELLHQALHEAGRTDEKLEEILQEEDVVVAAP